jgi:hypothetical protein
MKKTMTTSEIAHELIDDGNASWSRAGAFALAQYLEELEESTGEEMEFDHVAIRCEWSEYASLMDWADDCFRDHEDAAEKLGLNLAMSRDEFEENEETIDAAIRHYIAEKAEPAIEFDGGVVVPCF